CTTQEICDDENQSELVGRFKTIESEVITDTLISGATIYGIREGRPDSLLNDTTIPSLSRIVLPLDPHHDFSRFVLSVNDQTDTLRINHTTEFYMISYTCGFAARFNIENYDCSNTMIDTIEIINSMVDTELEQDEEHMWIYF
ncbi:MAG: DUF6452 family protein, partial [Bacteroidota bacterium]